jgi:predicted dehydrogenase
MTEPVGVGVVGCGVISRTYLNTLLGLPQVRVVAIADRDDTRAKAVAKEHGVSAATVDELLARSEVGIVLNLTTPRAHAEVALRAIAHSKAVHNEKPLAATTKDAAEILTAAEQAGVTVTCAPDTVLGTGIQTARKAIDDGAIGAPIAATATLGVPGHERWHPNPDFYYLPGGGPLLDMGPYYITALVTMLGPVAEVVGASSRTRPERTIASGARAAERIPVAVDTHVTGVLVHDSGVLSTLVMSFDVAATNAAPIEVHGTDGSLTAPDPNEFDGTTLIRRPGETAWSPVPVSAGYLDSARGIGIVDMAAMDDGEPPRASGALAYHVLDVMESLLRSAQVQRAVSVSSTCTRPTPVPLSSPWHNRSASVSAARGRS